MNLPTDVPATSAAAPTFTWNQVWVRALTQPSVATYEALVRDPAAGTGRALAWVAVSSLIGFALFAVAQMTFGAMFGSNIEETLPFVGQIGSLTSLLACGAPILVVGSLVTLIIDAGITQFVAGLLGGTGNFRLLAYALAAYLAPLGLVSSAVSLVPVVSLCITIPLGVYDIAKRDCS